MKAYIAIVFYLDDRMTFIDRSICYFLLILSLGLSCQAQDRANDIVQIREDAINTPAAILDDTVYNDAPNTITRNIIEDKNGVIWFATFEGIIKYEGSEFTNLTKDDSVRFFAVLEDRQGLLWFGSIGHGVYSYDGNSFRQFTTTDGLVNNRVSNIYEDSDGNLWFGTEQGISVFDGTNFSNITMEDGLLDDDINSIIQDNSGLYWIGTRGKAFTSDGSSFSEIINDDGDSYYNVRHIIRDFRGQMWMGGNDGLWRYNGSEYTRFSRDFTGYIYEDSRGGIWTSSVNASLQGWTLSQYDSISLNIGLPMATEIKSEESMFFGIVEDSSSNIWVGKLDGVYKLNGEGAVQDFKAR